MVSDIGESIGDLRLLVAGNVFAGGEVVPNAYDTLIQTQNGSIQLVQSVVKCFDNPPLRP